MCSRTSVSALLLSQLLSLGQYYIPPYDECNVEFLREIFSGRKKVSAHCVTESLGAQEQRSQVGAGASAEGALRSELDEGRNAGRAYCAVLAGAVGLTDHQQAVPLQCKVSLARKVTRHS